MGALESAHMKLLSERSEIYKVECWRWVNLLCYCGSMISTATIKYGFAPVALNVSTIYEVPILVVNFGVICYFIAYIIANYPAIWLLDQGKEQG